MSLSFNQIPELRLATKVAWMYHREGLKQTQIAENLSVSQSRVSRLLRMAIDEKIVRITVTPPAGVFTELETEVEGAFNLRECVLVESRGDEDALANDIGVVAAAYLQTTLQRREVIGISSWSNNWLQAVRRLTPFRDRVATNVTQLVGGLGDPRVQTQATLLLTHLSECTGAEAIFLQTPGIVADHGVQMSLLSDPSTSRATEAWARLTVALVGIGSVEASPLLRDSGIVSRELEQKIGKLGAVGDVCFHYFDQNGRIIDSELDNRIVGIPAEQLLATPRRVGAAGGSRKRAAILAALRGGWINSLITDTDTASYLLEEANK